jgi:hypothetical protein
VDTEDLARGFIARSLPKSEWTHRAHLRVGLWHALRYPSGQALDLLRERIRAYNQSVGGINSASEGYHETITRFYMHVIDAFLASVDARRPLDDLGEELIARCGAPDLPLRYYSRERLFSVEARLGWQAPDLRAIESVLPLTLQDS